MPGVRNEENNSFSLTALILRSNPSPPMPVTDVEKSFLKPTTKPDKLVTKHKVNKYQEFNQPVMAENEIFTNLGHKK